MAELQRRNRKVAVADKKTPLTTDKSLYCSLASRIFLLCALLCKSNHIAFCFSPGIRNEKSRATKFLPALRKLGSHEDMQNCDESCKFVNRAELSRRSSIRELASSVVASRLLFGIGISWGSVGVSSAGAEDPLFRKNPLTNKFLEQVRISEQEYADNIKYGGELGPAKLKETYSQLLVPILTMEQQFLDIDMLLKEYAKSSDAGSLAKAQSILNANPNFQKKEFKKTFNAFADNIYYSDPDRANVYLAGGTTPKPTQSLAYLLRNEILTNLDSLEAEIDYILKEATSNKTDKDVDSSDLMEYSEGCIINMRKYLDLVPPDELQAARKLLKEKLA